MSEGERSFELAPESTAPLEEPITPYERFSFELDAYERRLGDYAKPHPFDRLFVNVKKIFEESNE